MLGLAGVFMLARGLLEKRRPATTSVRAAAQIRPGTSVTVSEFREPLVLLSALPWVLLFAWTARRLLGVRRVAVGDRVCPGMTRIIADISVFLDGFVIGPELGLDRPAVGIT
jgi:hypothetical protein